MKNLAKKTLLSLVILSSFSGLANAGSIIEEFIPLRELRALGNENNPPQEQAEQVNNEGTAQQYAANEQPVRQENVKQVKDTVVTNSNNNVEHERELLINACKKALVNLYNESIDPPSYFRFNKTELIEDKNLNTMEIKFNYSTLKKTEKIEQNFNCQFAVENKYATSKLWDLKIETTSY